MPVFRAPFFGRGAVLGAALAAACAVYDESLLTGSGSLGSNGEGGEGGEADEPAGGSGGVAGATRGGTSGTGGSTGGNMTTTGGTPSGGAAGSEQGGSETGGRATGGTETGGTENGGTENGGTESGGTGAVSSGGSASGGTAGMGGMTMAGSGGAGQSGGSGGSGGACGKCGCGMPETDGDSDNVPDCIDICMGLNDSHCTALKNGLVHRYSFGGTGTQVRDSKGSAHGTAMNATLDGTGRLTLSGGNTSTPPYVNLPNGIISRLTNATIETWVTWNQSGTTGQNWQRIFDFGTTGTEDMQVASSHSGMSYVHVSPRVGSTPSVLSAAYSTSGYDGETRLNAMSPLSTGTRHHLALVLDDTNDTMALYLNGANQGLTRFTGALADISDVNNWLGRSSHSGDYEFVGVFDEFRIYSVALSAAQVSTSSAAGPDAPFLQ